MQNSFLLFVKSKQTKTLKYCKGNKNISWLMIKHLFSFVESTRFL